MGRFLSTGTTVGQDRRRIFPKQWRFDFPGADIWPRLWLWYSPSFPGWKPSVGAGDCRRLIGPRSTASFFSYSLFIIACRLCFELLQVILLPRRLLFSVPLLVSPSHSSPTHSFLFPQTSKPCHKRTTLQHKIMVLFSFSLLIGRETRYTQEATWQVALLPNALMDPLINR